MRSEVIEESRLCGLFLAKRPSPSVAIMRSDTCSFGPEEVGEHEA